MVIGSLQFNNISTNLSSSEGVIIIGGYEKARAACLRNAILDFDGEFFVIDCNNAFKSQVLKAEHWFKYINDKEISNFLLFLDQLITERKQALEQYVSLRDYYKHTQNQQHTGEIVLVINYQQKESSFNIECLHKLFSLIKDVRLLKKLSINVLFACESLNEVRFKDTLSRFSSKIYLGNDSIEDQIFLFEEPVYNDYLDNLVVFKSHKTIRPVFYDYPISNSLECWARNVLGSFIRPNLPQYAYCSEYYCLHCGDSFLFDNRVCSNCHAVTHYSCALGKLFLDAIASFADEYDDRQHFKNAVIKDVARKIDPETTNKRRLLKDTIARIKSISNYTEEAFDDDIDKLFSFYLNSYMRFVIDENKKQKTRIAKAEFVNIFNSDSFSISFGKKRLSILYGTNAFGKTTVFKTIHSFLEHQTRWNIMTNFQYLLSFPYREFKMHFSNGACFSVFKKSGGESPTLVATYHSKKDGRTYKNTIDITNRSSIDRHFLYLFRLIGFNWNTYFISSDRLDSSELFIKKLIVKAHSNNTSDLNFLNYRSLKDIYEESINPALLFSFIGECQRYIDSFEKLCYSNHQIYISFKDYVCLKEMFDQKFLSQSLISALYNNTLLINDNKSKQMTPGASRIEKMCRLYRRFASFKENFESFYEDYNPCKKTIWIINGAFVILTSNNQQIMYSDLSSGERNILSILEKIYFGTSDDVFLLIDEPEISLHISWQMKLIELISKINANKKKTQILIATHSPFIGTYHDDVIAEVKIKDVIQ